jgi:hypothetical protein
MISLFLFRREFTGGSQISIDEIDGSEALPPSSCVRMVSKMFDQSIRKNGIGVLYSSVAVRRDARG